MRFFTSLMSIGFFLVANVAFADDFANDDAFEKVQAESNAYEKKVTAEKVSEEARVKKEWTEFQTKVAKEWRDQLIPEQKSFVEYSDDLSGRVRVDYETGEVMVDRLEASASAESKEKAKVAIAAQLKQVAERDKGSSLPTFEASKENLSQITTSAPVTEKGTDGIERKRYSYKFKMPADYLQKRMGAVLPWVKEWAGKHDMNPSLILAVIRQESAFNPKARSWIPAFGLMQIVPSSAGREVMRKLTGKDLTPDEGTLYEPRSNVMFGSTYLKILQGTFAKTKNEINRNYLVICAYNWGPGRILKAITQGKIHPNGDSQALFNELQQIIPKETQGYLTRVSGFFKQFADAEASASPKGES
jgi:membrane-bound lytic murein transglycosylase C